jgi:FkbM family methyltransferase
MNLLFSIIDFFYQKKKYSFLKKKIVKNIDILIDVGAHHGDTISEFLNIFFIKKIYAFEPSKKNFEKLKKNIENIEKYNSVKIKIYPYGLGKENEIMRLTEIADGVSNTFNKLNMDSKYLKKKKFITTFFGIKRFINDEILTKVVPLKDILREEKIEKIDLIKIDTEGFEYNTLIGMGNEIKKVKFILFEHHYDNMIIKNYKFNDIHTLLKNNGFQKVYKIKMPFRKSFDYIYENQVRD